MSVELERAKSEILTLKRELSAVKLENRVLKGKPDEAAELRVMLKKSQAEVDGLKSDLKTAEIELSRFRSERQKSQAEVDEKRKSFSPGPNLELQSMRKRLIKAEQELWSLKNVRD